MMKTKRTEKKEVMKNILTMSKALTMMTKMKM